MSQRTRNSAQLVSIPTALRAARLRRFMSPEDLARASKTGVGTIKAAEGQPKSIHLSTAEKWATALRCDISEISEVRVNAEEVA